VDGRSAAKKVTDPAAGRAVTDVLSDPRRPASGAPSARQKDRREG
jgi:hypothetical protein